MVRIRVLQAESLVQHVEVLDGEVVGWFWGQGGSGWVQTVRNGQK